MSATSYITADYLNQHGRKSGVKDIFALPEGVKKAAKKAIHRATRRAEKLELSTLVSDNVSVRQLSAEELDVLTDAWISQAEAQQLQDVAEADVSDADDVTLAQLNFAYGTDLPLEQYAGMPDWMVQQLEATETAFDRLSILEVQQKDTYERRFRVSREDDGYENEAN